jgi:L-fuculose-phosphate aldolase
MQLGRLVYANGYVVSNGGNLSARVDSKVIIKKSGRSLKALTPRDFIITSLSNKKVEGASIDYRIHREIYLNTNSNYVLHSHPVIVIILSILSSNYIVPLDFESKYYLGEIPVIEAPHSSIYKSIGKLSSKNKIIVEKGHGVYIHGRDTSELYRDLERLERAAKIIVNGRLI